MEDDTKRQPSSLMNTIKKSTFDFVNGKLIHNADVKDIFEENSFAHNFILEHEKSLIKIIEKKKLYEEVIETSHKVITRTPFIVEVGAYTIGTNENNIIELQFKRSPTQWSKESTEDILEKCKFTNPEGPVIPTVYGYIDWYRKELKIINDVLMSYNVNVISYEE